DDLIRHHAKSLFCRPHELPYAPATKAAKAAIRHPDIFLSLYRSITIQIVVDQARGGFFSPGRTYKGGTCTFVRARPGHYFFGGGRQRGHVPDTEALGPNLTRPGRYKADRLQVEIGRPTGVRRNGSMAPLQKRPP